MTMLVHTRLLTERHLRAFMRQPVFLAANILQPLIWLLLFGQLFKSVVDIPGFGGGDDYLVFLTPGIVMMMALFASAWAGTTFIEDMNIGVMDRLLTSPTSRGGLIVATMWYQAVLTVMQTGILLAIAWLTGMRFNGGWTGIAILMLAAILLTFVFSAFSNAVALLARAQTALIGISQLIAFPMMFLSSAIMDTSLSPQWVRTVAAFNPVEWAVTAGRGAQQATVDGGTIAMNLALLATLAAVMTASATLAFGSYRRSR